MGKNNFPFILFKSLIGLVITCWILVLFWASNRGLDLTDEGFYLYYYQMPLGNKISSTYFHLIQNSFFPFVTISIQNLRIERLMLSIIFSLLFSWILVYYIKNTFKIVPGRVSLFSLYALSFSGVFLSYAFAPQTLSYNNFSSFFIIAVASLFLIDQSKVHSKALTSTIYLLIGFMCGALFLVKFPNAILLPVYILAFYFLYNIFGSQNKLSLFGNTMLRMVLIIAGYFLFFLIFIADFSAIVALHKNIFEFSTQISGHDKGVLLDTYIHSFTAVYESLCTTKFLLIILSLTGIAYCILKKKHIYFYILLIVQSIVIIRFKLNHGGEVNKTEQTIVYLLWILTLVIINIIKSKKEKLFEVGDTKKQIVFAVFLFILPIVGVLGTNNSIQVQIIFYMVFWLVLIYLLLEHAFEIKISKPIYLFLILLAFSQSVDGVVNHPYRINIDLLKQDQELMLGNKETILVDQKYKEQIVSIDSLLQKGNFKEGDYFYCYVDQTALAYIFNAQLPDGYWVTPENELIACKKLQELYKTGRKEKLFFIRDNRYPFTAELKSCLAGIGYDLDTTYYKVGEVEVDFSNDPHSVSIFAPIH